MAWSNHEISGDYMSAILVWLEGGGKDDLQQLAQVGFTTTRWQKARVSFCFTCSRATCSSWRRWVAVVQTPQTAVRLCFRCKS